MKPCKYCNGTGWYWVGIEQKAEKPGYGKVVVGVREVCKPCPRCHGKGVRA